MKTIGTILFSIFALTACAGKQSATVDTAPAPSESIEAPAFSADSAYSYIERQLSFGARVPGTKDHADCAAYLEDFMRKQGAEVVVQQAMLTAFDGTQLPARNILARFNPKATDRTLLLAHWDSRPWADQDPQPDNKKKPVPAANDGASGVAVLMEIARQLSQMDNQPAIDILFVDAEDYGTDGNDESWALGTRHFAQNPPINGYRPARAILLDMVGGENTFFTREYFSQQSAPNLLNDIWSAAASLGYGNLFLNEGGNAITDDHLELIKEGIPAIDIIGFSVDGSFPATWHTTADDISHISREHLEAVGRTLIHYLKAK